jgi:hypothetical protein
VIAALRRRLRRLRPAAQANQPGAIQPSRVAQRPAARPRAASQGGPQGRQHRHRRARSRTACRRRSREGILIGTVKRIEGEGELDRTIHVAPAADLRSLDFVQVLTAPAPTSAPRGHAVTWTPRRRPPGRHRHRRGDPPADDDLAGRDFGVPADLSPLLVAAVGLLCGSIAGAGFGFGWACSWTRCWRRRSV